jgi:Flp pilus assembly protein CpaB
MRPLITAHRSPRAIASWVAAAALTVVTARTVATDMARLHRQARSTGPLVAVVVARHDLALGHVVVAGDLTSDRVFGTDRPRGVVSSASVAVGRVVAVPILEGMPVWQRALLARGGGAVPAGTRIVRIPAGDGVMPAPGAVVDVLATFAATGDEPPTIAVARGALVVESTGVEAAGVDSNGANTSHDRGAGVLVLIPEAAAPRVVYALANATVTLTLAPLETACCTGLR